MQLAHDIQESLRELYPDNAGRAQERYARLSQWHRDVYGHGPTLFVSAPGRTELGGNHTDHNHGRVLASAIDLDSVAAVRPVTGETVTVQSEGFAETVRVDLRDLSPRPEERSTSAALVRGVAAGLNARGYRIGGFEAVVSSDVGVGSGLSSSAAFEVMIGGIFDALFNGWSMSPTELALAGQEAENHYFGKPCGLMDQLCASTGGALRIDFKDPSDPVVASVPFEPEAHGYALLVVNTGGSHADLTADYAAIPGEMRAVAELLGGATARDVTHEALMENLSSIRETCGDRALLRCMHFFSENDRVEMMTSALVHEQFQEFLGLVEASGTSSVMLLQNGYSPADPAHQSLMVALTLTERFRSGADRAICRLHGGGFAGTIQAYVPEPGVEAYRNYMSRWFGAAAVTRLRIRTQGVQTIQLLQH
jgi:galactokinase